MITDAGNGEPRGRKNAVMWAILACSAAVLLAGSLTGCGNGDTCSRGGCSKPPSAGSASVAAGAPAWPGWPGAPVVTTLSPVDRAELSMPLDGMSLAVSSDGARLLGVDSSGDVEEWNLRSGAARKLPGLGSTQPGESIAVSPDLTTLAVADTTDVITQQAATGKQFGDVSLDFGTNFFSVPGQAGGGQPGAAFSPDGKLVAYNDSHGNVYLLNVATQGTQVLPAPQVPPSSQTSGMDALAFSPDGKTLAVGTYTGAIFLWDVPGRRLLGTLKDPADTSPDTRFSGVSQVEALAFGENGGLLAAGDQNGNVYLWDVGRRSVIGALAESPAVSSAGTGSIAFSPDSGLLAASFASDIRVWSVATGRRLAVFDGASSVPSGPIAFALGSQLLVSLENTGPVTEWDLRR